MMKKSVIGKYIGTFAVSFILCLCISGCSDNEQKEEIKANLNLVIEKTIETEEVLGKVNEIIDWQIGWTTSEINYAELSSEEKQKTSRGTMSEEEVLMKLDELRHYMSYIEQQKSEVESLTYSGQESVDKTYDAVKEYYDTVLSSLDDLESILSFYSEASIILNRIYDIDMNGLNTDYKVAQNVCKELEVIISDLRKIDCPAFMEQDYDYVVKQYDYMYDVLEEYMFAVGLEDPLRMTAAISSTLVLSQAVNKYDLELVKCYNEQFTKSKERINGDINTLAVEIINNSKQIMKAL